jgi:nucleoid-associated protein YgaU
MLTKATLTDDMFRTVQFQFNPETLQFTAEGKYSPKTQADDVQYLGPAPIVLSLKMLLDEATGLEPVQMRLETLLSWTQKKNSNKDPYLITFTWGMLKVGQKIGLTCNCTKVTVDYQLFNRAGQPVRATASIELKEIPDKGPLGQNPTSGGKLPHKSHVLNAGDDLARLAHAEYGSAAKWRDIARQNGIDNPFRLPAGREMIFPDRLELDQ